MQQRGGRLGGQGGNGKIINSAAFLGGGREGEGEREREREKKICILDHFGVGVAVLDFICSSAALRFLNLRSPPAHYM